MVQLYIVYVVLCIYQYINLKRANINFCITSCGYRVNKIIVEPRFDEVSKDWRNLFVVSTVRYVENLDLTNLRQNNQNVQNAFSFLLSFFFRCDVALPNILGRTELDRSLIDRKFGGELDWN